MKLTVLGSNSRGNCYLLTDSKGKTLMIECGVGIREIKQGLDFQVSSVVGCLISHEHGDHAKSCGQVSALGIPIFASLGTLVNLKGVVNKGLPLKPRVSVRIGAFRVMGFDITHDAAEPFGFLIEHEEMGRMLFITDTYYCDYRFAGLSHIMIEANHSYEDISRKIMEGATDYHTSRLFKSHMSVETCCQFLRYSDLSQVQNVVLLHLSNTNGDEAGFLKLVGGACGRLVHVAKAGLVLDFNK